MRQLTQITVLIMLGIFWGTPNEAVAANEARCNELGANCVCSEPFNTPTWTPAQAGVSWEFNPADTISTDKECQDNGIPGGAYSAGSFNLIVDTAATNPTMFAALPAGATVKYVPRSAEGAGSGSWGTKFRNGVDSDVRRGMRFYRYYSPNFRFTDAVAPLCNSGKIAQLGWNGDYTGGPMFQTSSGFLMYDISASLAWNQSVDCCGLPMPGRVGTAPTEASQLGHWIRFEIYVNNTSTSGSETSIEWYVKDITAGTPEVVLANTAGDPRFAGVHPTSPLVDFSINSFRSNNGNPCDGYFAHSYYLAASWSTNAGQRIGAAVEIEGGGGGVNPAPAAPVGLTISKLMQEVQ